MIPADTGPPRLTTGAINALTGSDYALIPVILNAPSMNAVPRIVHWLYRLKHRSKVCPDVSLMGAVADLMHQSQSLTPAEMENWGKLRGYSERKRKDPIQYFQRFIPRRMAFA